MYYNGDASKPHLGKEMHFRRTLVPFTLDTSWIGPQVEEMYNCLQLDEAPDFNNSNCEDCYTLQLYQSFNLYIQKAFQTYK